MLSLIPSFLEIRLIDIIDILLVAFLMLEVYYLLRGTVAIRIFLGIVAFYLVWKIVNAFGMTLLSEIFGAFVSVGFIALIVVFQPEIRDFLLVLGTPNIINKKRKRFLFWRLKVLDLESTDTESIVFACRDMAHSKTGALIVIINKNELIQYLPTGVMIESVISQQLLENIFFKNSPLHDGAVIIRRNRIKAARCILPVSKSLDIPDHLGLRHRAAIGITEQSDALAIIVSEQTGKISYATGGEITLDVTPEKLKEIISGVLK